MLHAHSAPAGAARHSFYGVSTSRDPKFAQNNCTDGRGCPGVFLAAQTFMRRQPSCRKPHPDPMNVSDLLQKHTVPVLVAAPPGRRVLTFDGGCECGNHHPKDVLPLPAACDKAGVKANWSGIWWDHGAQQIARDFAETLGALQALGAPLVDSITLDSECDVDAFAVTSWQWQYNPSLSKECSDAHFDVLQEDPRFAAVLAAMERRGFVVAQPRSAHWLRDALQWDASEGFSANLAAWHVVQRERVSAYKRTAYFAPARAYSPAIQLSDYDSVAWTSEACSLEMNGFWSNGCRHTSTADAVVGTHGAPSFYGWMHNVSDGVNFPGLAGTLAREYVP
jgi:hypothetical protein